ncbi:single-stranded DNA-binding protein [Marinitenerispora sediminis]|uniref:Single-stranded DNA-binding protein n=1 Tax=Marinitenerispora sediminis TaxID=1931232 RepID=A0A368T6Z8_9ACTN|nr:single-stranded DNA-binding protein [Marinitenerispora sediminis]RCV54214.1 hypothetical protein DEF28_08685 [Marinitenerispora sediminis]RCV59513.1 hypothetical protein DEF24_09445 [Marinitenerispora sediminis]RCV59768.1 hypothetical protein DEF23_06365 [Marinitenerispora sediminis]
MQQSGTAPSASASAAALTVRRPPAPGRGPAPADGRRAEVRRQPLGGAGHHGHRNEVVLVGRVTAEPSVRELPSGDQLVTWRVSVSRPPAEQRPNQAADPITCVSFLPAIKEATRDWRIGDLVRISGALRRRFWRAPGGSASVFEVEAKTVARAEPAAPAGHQPS